MEDILNSTLIFAALKGAVVGGVAALVTDYNAFKKWKTLQEAAEYSWGAAGLRVLKGMGTGAATAYGASQFGFNF